MTMPSNVRNCMNAVPAPTPSKEGLCTVDRQNRSAGVPQKRRSRFSDNPDDEAALGRLDRDYGTIHLACKRINERVFPVPGAPDTEQGFFLPERVDSAPSSSCSVRWRWRKSPTNSERVSSARRRHLAT